MKKTEVVQVPQEREFYYCDRCGSKIGDEQEYERKGYSLSLANTGCYSDGSPHRCHWSYILCRSCWIELDVFLGGEKK